MAVFSGIVIPLLALIVSILALILEYLEYRKYIEESKKSQREGNPDKYINSKKIICMKTRGNLLIMRHMMPAKTKKKYKKPIRKSNRFPVSSARCLH